MQVRFRLLATVSIGALAGNVTLAAASDAFTQSLRGTLPAVSAVNGKIGAFGGMQSDDPAGGVFGAVAIPLRGSFGAQFDAMVGTADGDFAYGVGGHLFWRDPARGLVGAYAAWAEREGSDTVSVSSPVNGIAELSGAEVGKIGLEAEAYLNRISLEGFAGYQFGTEEGLAAKGTLAFYATDDLRLDVGVRHLEGPGLSVHAGAEWQPTASPFSVFADGGVGEDDNWFAFGGVKMHFGAGQKSLIRRHREDDPDVDLPFDLFKARGGGYCPPDHKYDEIEDMCDGAV